MDFQFTEDSGLILGTELGLDRLRRSRAAVGLPASASARNRWLLALHERGAPAANIPPRPIIRPALARPETREAMVRGLTASCEAAARGDPEGVTEGLRQAGQAGADGIRGYIDAGVSPGNAPSVAARKGFDKPMYETGELYAAFGFEIITQ